MSVTLQPHDSVISSPSGMSYELVLKPAAEKARRPDVTHTPGRSLSSDLLKKKLHDAEERRKMREREVIAKMNEETEKIKKARRSLLEMEEQQRSAYEKGQQKLMASSEKIVALRETQRQKLNKMLQKVEDARVKREEMAMIKSKLTEQKVDRKMEEMREKRESVLSAMLARLHAHDQYVEEIRHTMGKRSKEQGCDDKLMKELEAAENNREDAVNEMLESMPSHCSKEEKDGPREFPQEIMG